MSTRRATAAAREDGLRSRRVRNAAKPSEGLGWYPCWTKGRRLGRDLSPCHPTRPRPKVPGSGRLGTPHGATRPRLRPLEPASDTILAPAKCRRYLFKAGTAAARRVITAGNGPRGTATNPLRGRMAYDRRGLRAPDGIRSGAKERRPPFLGSAKEGGRSDIRKELWSGNPCGSRFQPSLRSVPHPPRRKKQYQN